MIRHDDVRLLRDTAVHEGFRATLYRCPAGKLTIGHGINLEAGISEAESLAVVKERYRAILASLDHRYAWFPALTANRQRAIAEMTYQLGVAGMAGFPKMLRALREGRYAAAADEMLDSLWARQTPVRAAHCAHLMRDE